MGIVGRKQKKYSKGFKLSAVEDVLVSQMGEYYDLREALVAPELYTWF